MLSVRGQREVGRAIVRVGMGRDLEAAVREPAVERVVGQPEAALDRLGRSVPVEDEEVDVGLADRLVRRGEP